MAKKQTKKPNPPKTEEAPKFRDIPKITKNRV